MAEVETESDGDGVESISQSAYGVDHDNDVVMAVIEDGDATSMCKRAEEKVDVCDHRQHDIFCPSLRCSNIINSVSLQFYQNTTMPSPSIPSHSQL